MPCTNDVDRAKCVGKIIYQSSTVPPININRETTLVESHGKEDQKNGSVNSTSHSNGIKKMKTVICNIRPLNYIVYWTLLFLLIFGVFLFSGSQLIVVILCILTLVLVIATALLSIKCIPKFCNISERIAQNLGSDSTVNSNDSSGSLLKNNQANGNSFVLMSIFVEYCVEKLKSCLMP